MDARLTKFLDRFHEIVGINLAVKRKELVAKLEDRLIRRAMGRFMQQLSKAETAQCDEYLKEHPQATGAQVADFLKKIAPSIHIENLFQEESQKLMQEYIGAMMRQATVEQEQKIKAEFEIFMSELKGA